MVFGIVAAFDGRAEDLSVRVRMAEDVDAGIRKCRTDGIGGVFRQFLQIFGFVAESDERHEREAAVEHIVWLDLFTK